MENEADLGWALGVVFRRYVKSVDAVIRDIPGGMRGYHVLALATGSQPKGQREICRLLGIDRTVLTYLIDDLEAVRLVERRPDPADRRSRLIVATDEGTRIQAERDAALRHVESHFLTGLGDDGPAFRGLLGRLAVEAQESDPITDTCQIVEDLRRIGEA